MTTTAATAFVPHDLKQPISGTPGGPLDGLTVAVKDMYAITGERTGAGNPTWLSVQQPAAENAVAVQKLLDAGGTVVGKTICDEFFYSIAGVNAHYGTPPNPRAPGRIPGGSSSGSASATAAGACDIGLGSDTGGSVRIPASFCGLYSLRTTHGRVDATGAMAMAPSFDSVGWFTTGPGLLRKVGGVLLGGAAKRAAITRVLVAEDAFAEADAPVTAMLMGALGRMRELPAARQSVRLGGSHGLDARRDIFRIIQAHETWATFRPFVEKSHPTFGPGVQQRFEAAAAITDAEVTAARGERRKIFAELEALIPPGTIVAMPTAPSIAPATDAPLAELESVRLRVMRLTCSAGLGGLAQLTMPVGTISKCPVGLSLLGWRGADEDLLDLAALLGHHCGTTET